jgi:hypothetical protein
MEWIKEQGNETWPIRARIDRVFDDGKVNRLYAWQHKDGDFTFMEYWAGDGIVANPFPPAEHEVGPDTCRTFDEELAELLDFYVTLCCPDPAHPSHMQTEAAYAG